MEQYNPMMAMIVAAMQKRQQAMFAPPIQGSPQFSPQQEAPTPLPQSPQMNMPPPPAPPPPVMGKQDAAKGVPAQQGSIQESPMQMNQDAPEMQRRLFGTESPYKQLNFGY